MKTVSILIPVYNEAKTINELLTKVRSAPFCNLEKQIVIVDDYSTDGTRDQLKEIQQNPRAGESVYFHEKNMGKGAALRTALNYASGDIIVIQDADLEYDPNEYDELIKLILNHNADVVYGSRLTGSKPARQFKFLHYVGNKFLSLLTNILYDTTITDMETCYKAFRAEVVKNIVIRSNRFEFEPEITAKVLKTKYRFYEVPISYYGRDFADGKKITWKDGVGALRALLYFAFLISS